MKVDLQGKIWGKIGQTKLSMFYYKYPLLEQTAPFEGIQLASLADIAAMKIHAIEDRGTRRDFVDVYFLAKKYTLEDMLNFYQKKYAVKEYFRKETHQLTEKKLLLI